MCQEALISSRCTRFLSSCPVSEGKRGRREKFEEDKERRENSRNEEAKTGCFII